MMLLLPTASDTSASVYTSDAIRDACFNLLIQPHFFQHAMADNVSSTTVLLSAFGTAILVCMIYFIHAHLGPHLRRLRNKTKARADTPPSYEVLPRWQVRSNTQLRETLYNRPTPNYLDPRNSVIGSELQMSRWPTDLPDLSRPSPEESMPLVGKRHVRHFSLLDVPLTPNRRLPAPSVYSNITQWNQEMRKRDATTLEHTRRRSARPVTIAIDAAIIDLKANETSTRLRSRSEPQLCGTKSALASDQAWFFGRDFAVDPQSPISSVLSESASQFDSSPESESRESSRTSLAVLSVSTAHKQ